MMIIKMEKNVTYRRPAGCGGQIISRDRTYLTVGKIINTVIIIINIVYGHCQLRPHLPNNWEMNVCKHDFKHIENSCKKVPNKKWYRAMVNLPPAPRPAPSITTASTST